MTEEQGFNCGDCNEEVYRTTPEKYNPADMREALNNHKQRCRARTEVPA